jgi:hypothetical protein
VIKLLKQFGSRFQQFRSRFESVAAKGIGPLAIALPVRQVVINPMFDQHVGFLPKWNGRDGIIGGMVMVALRHGALLIRRKPKLSVLDKSMPMRIPFLLKEVTVKKNIGATHWCNPSRICSHK